MKAFESVTSLAKDLLWQKLFDQKQFYAFEFVRDFHAGANIWDFACPELGWIVHISSDAITSSTQRSLVNGGHKLTILHPNEVQSDFPQVETLLTEALKDIVGRPCGE